MRAILVISSLIHHGACFRGRKGSARELPFGLAAGVYQFESLEVAEELCWSAIPRLPQRVASSVPGHIA